MIITLIAAMAENRVIGRENGIPWDLPEDRKRFRAVTMGHPVIMGRRTYQSLPRQLDGRTVIVLSRNRQMILPDDILAGSLEEAFLLGARSPGGEELFIAGGGELYRQALPLADRICLTIIHQEIPGDVTFPELPVDCFTETCRDELLGKMPATFIRLEKTKKSIPTQEV